MNLENIKEPILFAIGVWGLIISSAMFLISFSLVCADAYWRWHSWREIKRLKEQQNGR